MQKNEICTLQHPYAQRKMISLGLIAKDWLAALGIFSGELKECHENLYVLCCKAQIMFVSHWLMLFRT